MTTNQNHDAWTLLPASAYCLVGGMGRVICADVTFVWVLSKHGQRDTKTRFFHHLQRKDCMEMCICICEYSSTVYCASVFVNIRFTPRRITNTIPYVYLTTSPNIRIYRGIEFTLTVFFSKTQPQPMGDIRSIIRHGTGLVYMEYSGLSTRGLSQYKCHLTSIGSPK